ncbi:MAG: alpha/beta hydrolase [Betaproteobacteria bacterium]|nr:alpha/beta hydrolase [Betaproteobacteria bacterium]
MTPKTAHRALLDGPGGKVEVVVNVPDGALAGIALIAHPHSQQGGSLDNKVVQTLAKTFFALSHVAVRFNFRGVGGSTGAFDEGVGETQDALAVLAYARARWSDSLPVVLAGFSFGSFVQTRVAKEIVAHRLVLIGPAVGRFAAEKVPADTIIVHGEEDDIVALADVLAWARPQELPIVVFPGCGHYFHGRLLQLQRVITGMWRPPVS